MPPRKKARLSQGAEAAAHARLFIQRVMLVYEVEKKDQWTPIRWAFILESEQRITKVYQHLILHGNHMGMDMQLVYDTIRDNVPEVLEIAEDVANKDEQYALATAAFQWHEICGPDAASPSAALLHQLDQMLAKVDGTAFTPYTALVLPSGAGKSFAVKQIAQTHGRWVIYACLSTKNRTTFPPASPLSRYLTILSNIQDAVLFFSSFLHVGLGLACVAAELGITPGHLFAIQAEEEYAGVQEKLAELATTYNEYDIKRLHLKTREGKRLTEKLEASVRSYLQQALEDGASNAGVLAAPESVFFCFDEARALLMHGRQEHTEPPFLLDAWRQALKNMQTTWRGQTKPFGLLLDTSSRVANFIPPKVRRPGTDQVVHGDLLPPIFALPTWDVVASTAPAVHTWLQQAVPHRRGKESEKKKPAGESGAGDGPSSHNSLSGSDGEDGDDDKDGDDDDDNIARVNCGPDGSPLFQAFVFSLGRPLWASVMRAAYDHADNDGVFDPKDTVALSKAVLDTVQLAWDRIGMESDDRPIKSIALLSYRMQFYVVQQDAANELTANWMRFPIFVSDDRRYVRSIQPGEPILAAIAAMAMSQPASRETILRDFAHHCNNGTVDVGDAGEIVASLLLLLAADALVPEVGNLRPPVCAVPLSDFLHSLLGLRPPASWDTDGKQVYLTHFVRFVGNERMRPRQLEMAFLTGEAWFFEPGYIGADLLVPVWDTSQEGEGRVGAVLVQVKNRARTPTINKTDARSSLTDAKKHLKTVLNGATTYGLFLELRHVTTSNVAKRVTPILYLPPDAESLKKQMYVGIAGGFDPAVFPVLGDSEVVAIHLQAILERGSLGYDKAMPGLRQIVTIRDGQSLGNEQVRKDRSIEGE